MKKFWVFVLEISLIYLSHTELSAKSSWVSRIPNGNKFGCKTCHSNVPSLNPFGQAIKNGYLSGGSPNWISSLANLDSDGDGFTNGEELQDPDGQWKYGDANPGDASLVSNPGDPSSTPPANSVNEASGSVNKLKIYPNPAKDLCNIRVELTKPSYVGIAVYNVIGEKVASVSNSWMQSGENDLTWDLNGLNSNKLSSGKYFIEITTDGKYKAYSPLEIIY